MKNDPFNFDEFIANAANPDEATRSAHLRDAVSDQMDSAMSEIAPRLWCIMQAEMLKDPKNEIHLNAVINASIFAILGWLAVCTPKSGENDQTLRDRVMKNLDNAMSNARDQGAEMSKIAYNVGKMKLMEDAMAGLSTIITQNSMIVQGVHSAIKDKKS